MHGTQGKCTWDWAFFIHAIVPWLICGLLAFAPLGIIFLNTIVHTTHIQEESWSAFFNIFIKIFDSKVLHNNNVLGIGLSLSSAFVCSILYVHGSFVRLMLVFNIGICIIYAFCMAQPFQSIVLLYYFNILGLGFIIATNIAGFLAAASGAR